MSDDIKLPDLPAELHDVLGHYRNYSYPDGPPFDRVIEMMRSYALSAVRAAMLSSRKEIPVLDVRPCALCQRSDAGYVCTGACEDANREG